jgi:hypothetical protein
MVTRGEDGDARGSARGVSAALEHGAGAAPMAPVPDVSRRL